jgi:hypothetical protein
MMISVMYRDGIADVVKTQRLDYLLAADKVAQFKRTHGWVTVGVDSLRGPKNHTYSGPERRALVPVS